ncbi:11997_t:CDS:2, partial [Funneliformis geosporum]
MTSSVSKGRKLEQRLVENMIANDSRRVLTTGCRYKVEDGGLLFVVQCKNWKHNL